MRRRHERAGMRCVRHGILAEEMGKQGEILQECVPRTEQIEKEAGKKTATGKAASAGR